MSPQNGRRVYCTKYIIPTADPFSMGRKLRQYAIFQYSVRARLSAHTDWISYTYVFGATPSASIFTHFVYSSTLIYGTGTSHED